MSMFKELTPEEEISFRQWARNNYIVGAEIKSFWHPAVQKECAKMNEELDLTARKSSGIWRKKA
jgi:hypothetical protein